MAPFSNYISFLFLTTLLLPLQIIARDSQFFSKVPHFNNNDNVKETELPKKEDPVNKKEQQPVFIPETENSYGLYGHESESPKLPSTTTTNAAPYTTTTNYLPYETEIQHTSKYPNKYNNYNNDAFNTDQNELSNTRLTGTGYSYNNNNYYNKDAYEGNQNEFSDTKHNQKYYYNNNAANNRYSYSNNNYNGASDRYSYNNNAANNRYNSEKQGMSDTRFLEGGKYFYDMNSEKYDPTLYGDSSRGVKTNTNWYNNGGSYYGNKGGYNVHHNAYQNQGEFEDEQDDFEP